MTSRPKMIINILKAHPDEQFTARQLAQKIIDHYGAELASKRQNGRFTSDQDFIRQIAAEIGGSRTVRAKAKCPQVMTRDKPRPRLFYWGKTSANPVKSDNAVQKKKATSCELASTPSAETLRFSEHDLYPLLIKYLSEEESLLCRRIDEKRSGKIKNIPKVFRVEAKAASERAHEHR